MANTDTQRDQTSQSGEPVAEFSGIRIEKSIIVTRARQELYQFWRNFENLPRLMGVRSQS